VIKAQGYIRRDGSETTAVPVILDTAAQVNIVDEKYALENGFKELRNHQLPTFQLADKSRTYSHKAYQIQLELQDSWNRKQEKEIVFYGMIRSAHPILLGTLGL
jgi:hypothetical protein